MKIYSLRSIVALLFLVTFVGIGATAANAQAPDLQVLAWQGSTTPLVETTYQYTTSVQNIGGAAAQGAKIVIDFPLTNTTPVKILGRVIGVLPTGCTFSPAASPTKIQCNLGTMLPNDTRSVTIGFQFQVATIPQTLTSTASTTTVGEVNTANNSLSFTPTLTYPDNEILFPVLPYVRVSVVGCSGRGLTSFYACELFPSSQTPPFLLDLNIGGTTTLVINTSYTGIWDQNTLPSKSLHFMINRGTSQVDFNGYAVSANCFKGITTFPGSGSAFNAAYRVCRQ